MSAVADGLTGAPTLFDRTGGAAIGLTLQSITQLENGILHLRYAVTR